MEAIPAQGTSRASAEGKTQALSIKANGEMAGAEGSGRRVTMRIPSRSATRQPIKVGGGTYASGTQNVGRAYGLWEM